jgi:hypothetical protein
MTERIKLLKLLKKMEILIICETKLNLSLLSQKERLFWINTQLFFFFSSHSTSPFFVMGLF